MPRIDAMYAFVISDTSDDDEGVVATLGPGNAWVPMVGADRARLDSLRTVAQQIASAAGKKIRLVRFSVREELDVIEPRRKPTPGDEGANNGL